MSIFMKIFPRGGVNIRFFMLIFVATIAFKRTFFKQGVAMTLPVSYGRLKDFALLFDVN